VFHGGYLAYVAVIALLGATAMAANQALISIEALSYQIAEGLGVAAGVLVGQQLGEGRPDEASRSCLVASGLAVTVLSGFALIFAATPRLLLGMFSADPTVIDAGATALLVAAAAQPVMAFAVVTAMALRAAGATRTLLWTTAACGVVIRLAATWVFAVSLDLGLLGVWLGSGVDWLAHAAILGVVLVDGRWRRITV
jgi:Na+-driven multidrug efflux pump